MTKKKIKILSLSLLGAMALVVPTAVTAVSCAGAGDVNDGAGSKKPITTKTSVSASTVGFTTADVAHNAKSSIDKQWIVSKITNLVNGDTELIDNVEDIKTFSVEVANNNQLSLNFTIKGGSSYNGSEIDNLDKQISLTITDFKQVMPISKKSDAISVTSLSELDKNLSGVKAKTNITADWIIRNINTLLSGETSNIKTASDIIYDNLSTTADATSINFSFKVKSGKSFQQDGKPTIANSESFAIKITDFTSPGLKQKQVNANDIGLQISQFAYKEVTKITSDFVKTNIDKFVSGDTSLIKGASTASDALEVSTTIANKNTINLKLVIKAGFAYDGTSGVKTSGPTTFNYTFTGFNNNVNEISAKPSISIDGSGLTEFAKDKSILETIKSVGDGKNWVLANKSKLFNGTLDELDNANADVESVVFTPSGTNKYHIDALKIDIKLKAGVSIINGTPSTEEQASSTTYTINVTNFNESLSEKTIEFIQEAKIDKIINNHKSKQLRIGSYDLGHNSKVSYRTQAYDDNQPGMRERPWATLMFSEEYPQRNNLDKHKEIIIESLFKILDENCNLDGLEKTTIVNTWDLKISKSNPKMLQLAFGLSNEIQLSNLLSKYGFTDIEYFKIPITIIKTDKNYQNVDNVLHWEDYNYYKITIGNVLTAYNSSNNKLFNVNLKYANSESESGTEKPFSIDFFSGLTETVI